MDWENERRVADGPETVQSAHRHSIHHRATVMASESCGCFYCCSIFPPDRIVAWTDASCDGEGQTALCPECGIDSVVGDGAGFSITAKLLTDMKAYWF
jgi:hypothetical protein